MTNLNQDVTLSINWSSFSYLFILSSLGICSTSYSPRPGCPTPLSQLNLPKAHQSPNRKWIFLPHPLLYRWFQIRSQNRLCILYINIVITHYRLRNSASIFSADLLAIKCRKRKNETRVYGNLKFLNGHRLDHYIGVPKILWSRVFTQTGLRFQTPNIQRFPDNFFAAPLH